MNHLAATSASLLSIPTSQPKTELLTEPNEVEPLCGRERGAAERESAGEILSETAKQASRRNSPLADDFDEEEEFDIEDPDGAHGYRELSPLNHRFTRSHTPPGEPDPDLRNNDGAARIAAANHAPRCRHIKAAGNRCKAPALRGGEYCHLHHRLRVGPRLIHPTLTQLEDAHGIQVALMEVLTGILDGRLDNKTGALLLYGLQTAVANLKHMPDLDEDDITTEEPVEDEADFDPESNAAAEKAAAADSVRSTYDHLAARYPIHARPTGDTARDARHAESLASYFDYDPSQPNPDETPAPHKPPHSGIPEPANSLVNST